MHIQSDRSNLRFRLINKLSKAAGLPATTFNPKASSSFVAMSNIENFNNAAKAYGVPITALFQTPDLYEGRKGPLLNVINCLNQLGFVVCNYVYYLRAHPSVRPFVCLSDCHTRDLLREPTRFKISCDRAIV